MTAHRATYLLCLLLVWGGAWLHGAGVTDDYLVEGWTSENGLPDSSVTAITQTPDGYLWVGTYNGVARFDGVRFVTFDPANTPALSHARVRKLYVDQSGVLWIVGYDGSLVTCRDGNFTLENRNSRFSEGELVLVSSSSNHVAFLTGRGELFRKRLPAPPGEGWEVVPPPARGLNSQCCQDGAGTFWYRDGDKHLWRLMEDKFVPVPDSAGLAGQNINHLTVDASGKIWVGTDRGIACWDGTAFQFASPAGTTAVDFLAVAPEARVWTVSNGAVGVAQAGRWQFAPDAGHQIFSANPGRIGALADHRGGMWFYNYGRGLVHVTAAGQIRPLTAADGFPGDRVYAFFEDQEGDWWAGLDAGGLVRVRERQFHAVGAGDNNLMKAAKTVAEDGAGTVWIGMLSGGLSAWQDGGLTNLSVQGATGGGSVFCVCPDRRGRLWLSAGDEDLFVREQGVIRRVLPVIHGVKTILEDREGRLWLGTTSGLYVSETGEDFRPFTNCTWRYIRALAEDKNGVLWAGTGGGELIRVTGNTAKAFHPRDNQESGAIWSVRADADGTIWAGTFRGGLLRFREGQFTRFGKKEGLPSNVICQILDDGQGNLWVGSHQGIFRVAKAALEAFARGEIKFIPSVDYGRSDGVPSLECSGGYQPSATRDGEGRLWFATVKGAAWIQPAEIRLNQKPPPVVIEEVMVDGRAQSPADGGARIEIAPGRHQIEFRYTGLSLAAPERVQFQYQLENIDAGWRLAGTRRSVQYNALPPGEYLFRVIACNSDGIWNEAGDRLAVVIRPHYYETWWFRTLVVLVVLGGVAGFVRHAATRRLHRQMEALERKQMLERERARIAKDIHDDLGASLTLIAVLGDLAKKEKADERLEKMSGTAREAVKSLDEIVWAVNPRNDTLSHLIDYTGQFAADYLRDVGIRCLLDVPEQVPVRAVPSNVRHNLFLVVKEALQNIVKHAHATEVWLRVQLDERSLRVAVEDNGCGFDKDPQDAWADGLRNMRQRLAEIGGDCRIQSQVGRGTTITIELAWPEN